MIPDDFVDEEKRRKRKERKVEEIRSKGLNICLDLDPFKPPKLSSLAARMKELNTSGASIISPLTVPISFASEKGLGRNVAPGISERVKLAYQFSHT